MLIELGETPILGSIVHGLSYQGTLLMRDMALFTENTKLPNKTKVPNTLLISYVLKHMMSSTT